MTTFVPPQLVRTTGTLTVEDIILAAQTGNEGTLACTTDLAAAGDIHNILFSGEDSATNPTQYAGIIAEIVDATDASEDGALRIETMQAGSNTEVLTMALGMTMNGATGGDQGNGTINATGLFVNGSAVTVGGGDVSKVGTPVDNQVGVWTGDGTIEGDANLTFDTTSDTLSTTNLTVTGDLTVSGTTTQLDVANLSVEDPLLNLARGNTTTDAIDIGMVGLYDTSGSQDLYAGLFRDADDNKFKLFVDSQEDLSTAQVVNTGAAGYTVATLVADIEGTADGNVANTLYDAQSVIVAVADDTPIVQTVGDSEFVGRSAGGNVGVITKAQALTILNLQEGVWQTTQYVDGVDFTAGTSNSLTVTAVAGNDEDLVRVRYHGIDQHQDQWSIAGTTLTFTATIPVGVTDIEVAVKA